MGIFVHHEPPSLSQHGLRSSYDYFVSLLLATKHRRIILQPTLVDCSTVQAHEGVYFSCPLCPASTLLSEKDEHLSACLDKVFKIYIKKMI